jgi:hypothetical protein
LATIGWRDHRETIPPVVACLFVGLLFAGLLIGYEPVGGDPDRIFRPIKAELAHSLRKGQIPFWSERLGMGVPLVAESQVAAFYPPNWVLYRAFDVSTAYRLSMWIHCVGIAAASYAYSRQIGISSWGSALAGVAFPFCGFLTIHSSHEWAYQTLLYLPLCLLAADRYAKSGRSSGLAVLAILWAVQIAIGHFQVQMWTGALALALGAWRVLVDRLPTRRILGLALALLWGAVIGSVQLVPTWELTKFVGQTKRSFAELAYYSYPPGHWAELAVPALFRRLAGGGEAPYWFTQQTTGFEACLFVGTIPLIMAIIGITGGGRELTPWKLIVPLSFALATMPRWWPQGYAMILQLPGVGYFRCPARYTAITSLGLALLAGSGLDRSIAQSKFRTGLILALFFVIGGFAWCASWVVTHRELQVAMGGEAGLAVRMGAAALCWAVAFGLVVYWRKGQRDLAWVIPLVSGLELGAYYYAAGTTQWGWSVALPRSSPVMTRLLEEPRVRRVGGALDNLPLRAGLATATPYTGFTLFPPHPLLKAAQDRGIVDASTSLRWLRRYGVTHVVWDSPLAERAGEVVYRGEDRALDVLAYRSPGSPERRRWQITRLANVFPEAWTAIRTVNVPDHTTLVNFFSQGDYGDEAWYVTGEGPSETGSQQARSATIVRWSGLEGEVEHDGTCDLIVNRAYYPGWLARVDNGDERRVHRADGGLIAVRLEGAGKSRVALHYRPNGFPAAAIVSAVSLLVAFGFLFLPRVSPASPAQSFSEPSQHP